MLNLFQNRKIEADEHRSCNPETSSGCHYKRFKEKGDKPPKTYLLKEIA